MYIPSKENERDAPSCRLTTLDCKLHPKLWKRVQQEFGGPKGHTYDLMALDSNAMTDQDGSLLPHFTPHPSPQSCGVNFFVQDLSSGAPFLEYPYDFPPLSLTFVTFPIQGSLGISGLLVCDVRAYLVIDFEQ